MRQRSQNIFARDQYGTAASDAKRSVARPMFHNVIRAVRQPFFPCGAQPQTPCLRRDRWCDAVRQRRIAVGLSLSSANDCALPSRAGQPLRAAFDVTNEKEEAAVGPMHWRRRFCARRSDPRHQCRFQGDHDRQWRGGSADDRSLVSDRRARDGAAPGRDLPKRGAARSGRRPEPPVGAPAGGGGRNQFPTQEMITKTPRSSHQEKFRVRNLQISGTQARNVAARFAELTQL